MKKSIEGHQTAFQNTEKYLEGHRTAFQNRKKSP